MISVWSVMELLAVPAMLPSPTAATDRRLSGGSASGSARSRCCISLLYGQEKGHVQLMDMASDLGRGDRI